MGLKSTLHVAATPVRFYGKKTLNIPLVLTLFAKFACHSRRAVNAHVSTVRCCDLARSPIAVAVILTHWTTIEKTNKTKQNKKMMLGYKGKTVWLEVHFLMENTVCKQSSAGAVTFFAY